MLYVGLSNHKGKKHCQNSIKKEAGFHLCEESGNRPLFNLQKSLLSDNPVFMRSISCQFLEHPSKVLRILKTKTVCYLTDEIGRYQQFFFGNTRYFILGMSSYSVIVSISNKFFSIVFF